MKTVRIFLNMLFLSQMLLMMCACSDDDEGIAPGEDMSGEVRAPSIEEIDGKAVLTWVDPYIKDMKEVQLTDLQNNQQQTVAKGVQRAQFEITDASLLAYRYELKVIKEDNSISQGRIVRLIKNWAQHLHPVLDYNNSAAPQSGMFYKTEPVATVKVFDIRKDENMSRMLCAAMQGIINQTRAETYLMWEQQHLDILTDAECSFEMATINEGVRNPGFTALYNMYKDRFNKLVLWDEEIDWTWSLALMISSQQQGLPVTEEYKNFIENNLGGWNKEIVDIRHQWSERAEAYNWAIENLAKNCHPMISFSGGLRSDYKDNPWRMFDYAVACKGFVFWLDETDDYDKEIMTNIFRSMEYPVGSSVFGYGMNSNGDELNRLTNTFNSGFVVSDYYANGSYWCSFPNKSFQQRTGVAEEVEAGKIYVAISLSDGDNVQFDMNSLYKIFKDAKRRDEVPVGVTLAAGLQELNPKLLEFYYKNITQNDELTAGPSGIQFIYGDQYAQSGKYDDWLEMNKQWLSTAGFHTAHLWNTDEQVYFKQYMEKSGVDLVMDGSDRTHTTGASYKYVNGVVRIDQGTHCRADGDVYRDLMALSPSPRRPLFRHVYLLTDYYGFESDRPVVYERLIKELARVEEDCPDTYVYMLPMDLAATIKKYIEDGGIY